MANQEQLEILKQGAKTWNKWRNEISLNLRVDLTGANLSKANLEYFDLWDVDLSDADLSHCSLINTNYNRSNLSRVNLSESDLRGSNLSDVNLSEANLKKSQLDHANLIRTNLHKANLSEVSLYRAYFIKSDLTKSRLSNAIMSETVLAFIDLSDSIDIETIAHYSPSSISIETIQLSSGKLSEVFLRGCGLSDLQIETAKLATPDLGSEQVTDITYKIHQLYLGGGIQYYSCFISYSSKDHEFAQRLHDDLQNNGVRCWFDREDIKIGDKIRPAIDRQIRLRDKLLVILSENSINSEYVGDEVEAALEEEQKSNKLSVFPIRLDDTVLNTRDDWAAKIKRRRHIGDFSNWKDKASYQKALERLLRDLKATGGQVNGE